MKTNSKRTLFVILALVMALGLASAVYADSVAGEVGYTPNPDSEELWFSNNTFTTRFTQTLDITDPVSKDVTPVSFDLGINTIEIIFYASNTYYLTLHPQYFGPGTLPYDDQYNAQYHMELQGLLVWDTATQNYENYFSEGFPKFPDTCLLGNAISGYYAQCIVTSSIENDKTGKLIGANWNGEVAYLKIPPSIYPTAPF